MKNFLYILLVAVFLVGAGYLLMNKKPASVPKAAVDSTAPTVAGISSESSSGAVKEFTMTAKQFAFDPAEITVKQGDKVRINIKSIDVEHGFSLPDFNINVNLTPGINRLVEFTADKKGKFIFSCSVMCGQGHKDMVGKLIVE